jgi:CMP-N,N'-diacetyllegionaminic acid synthase
MKILALITARGGSKRLPGKNIRLLGNKPLIVWSIDVVKNIPKICDILVSTDDLAIAKVSQEAGAYVPWLRPSELASDSASSVSVALHALNWYESEKGAVDGVLLLQPTSPFRTHASVIKGIGLFEQHSHKPVLGVSITPDHPMWMFKMVDGYLRPYLSNHTIGIRSQDLPIVYVANGSFYLISSTDLREKGSFVGEKTIPLIADSPENALDIDTEWDWSIACAIAENFSH